jgi:hypothetical protein
MTVAIWCKINAAAFYAGTHQKPRLTIRYDNTTDVYAEALATTDWQLLAINFTPITSYGEITVTLSARTDAIGSDAYVYFDDWSVLYPADYVLNLGGMDLWANAMPIIPPIATVLSAQDVWTAQTAVVGSAAGSMGKLLVDNVNAPVGDIPTNPLLSTDSRLNYLDGSIAAIPTTPLLVDDERLGNLDAKISDIPTDPLLAADPRLDYIDVAISRRAAPSDIPTSEDVANAVFEENATGHNGFLTKLLTIAKFMGLK